MNLFDPSGHRLYLAADERAAFLEAAKTAPREVRTFCHVLHDTGCRLSEALAMPMRGVDLPGKVIVLETLKKRRRGVYRAVPVRPELLELLDMVHGVREAQQRGKPETLDVRLWPWTRTHAWRLVKGIMARAKIPDGPQKSPKGLRHGFGVAAISAGIPLNMLCKWMGHASTETTAIYANAVGEEEQSIAARMWG